MDWRDGREHDDLTRRVLLKRAGIGAGLVALPGFLSACGGDEAGTTSTGGSGSASSGESPELARLLDSIESEQVVIANYGGTTEDARRAAFWDPFTERTGVQVVQTDIPGNLANEMLEGNVPPRWDAFHGSAFEARLAQLDGKKELPRTPEIAHEDLISPEYQPYLWQSFFVGYVPAYLPGTYSGEQPQTWADFFDTKKFPGKRAWPSKDYTSGTHEAALLADGVPPDEVYPMDIERAQAKIKALLPDILVYQQYPQAQSFLTSKSVAMAHGPNGLWKGLADKNVDLTVAWTMTPILESNGMCTIPDAPHMDAVMALAAFCNDPGRQAEFALQTNYGPPSQAAFDQMSKAEQEQLPNAPGRTVLEQDIEWIAEHEPEILESNKQIFS